MATNPTDITALPPAPDPDSDESTFDNTAYAWTAALPTFVTQTNNAGDATYANAVEAGNAASSATTSAITAGAAATTATTAATNLSTLDALWLGAAFSDPATGKLGVALVAGNAYVNTVTGYLRAYNGTSWVQGVSAVAGVSTVNGMTGAVTIPASTPFSDNTALAQSQAIVLSF